METMWCGYCGECEKSGELMSLSVNLKWIKKRFSCFFLHFLFSTSAMSDDRETKVSVAYSLRRKFLDNVKIYHTIQLHHAKRLRWLYIFNFVYSTYSLYYNPTLISRDQIELVHNSHCGDLMNKKKLFHSFNEKFNTFSTNCSTSSHSLELNWIENYVVCTWEIT